VQNWTHIIFLLCHIIVYFMFQCTISCFILLPESVDVRRGGQLASLCNIVRKGKAPAGKGQLRRPGVSSSGGGRNGDISDV
jgi:hypothetical protein